MKLFFFLSYSKYHRVDKIYFYIKFRWEIWKRKNLEQYRHDFVYLTINFLHATLPGKSWRFRWRNALRIFLSSNINLSTYKLNLSTFHVSKDYCHARGNLITFYDKKTTEHEGLKRKKRKYNIRYYQSTLFSRSNEVLSPTVPNIILQKDLVWKIQTKVLLS